MHKRKIFFVLLILAPFFFASEARAASWEFAGWYGGGFYPYVEFDPQVKGRVYLTSDVAGIWRSDDLGDHWNPVNKGLTNLAVALVSVAPSDSNVIYAGTKGGLFLSRNAGHEWTKIAPVESGLIFSKLLNYRSLAVDPEDAGKICAGGMNGVILCSSDFGQTWNALSDQAAPSGGKEAVTSLIYDESRKHLYAASSSGILKYSFENGKWEKLSQSPSQVTDLLLLEAEKLLAAGRDGIFLSEDGGRTWAVLSTYAKGMVVRLAAFMENKTRVILAVWERDWKGGVLMSRDMGKSWSALDSKMDSDENLDPTRRWARAQGRTKAIKINPFDSKVFFRTDWWGVWRSDDGGASWKEKIHGAANTVGSDLAVTSQGHIYAAMMDNGLLRSTDGGKNYEPMLPGRRYRRDLNGHFWRTLVLGENERRIVVTSSPWDEDRNQVLVSEDGGKHFIAAQGIPEKRPKQNAVWGEGYPRALTVSPQNQNLLYLGIDGEEGGLFFSENGGHSWKASAKQPASKRIYNALGVDPQDPKRIYWGTAGTGGGLYLSEDGGRSWNLAFQQSQWIFDLTVAPSGKIYLGTDSGGPAVYVSADRGKTWRQAAKFEGTGTVEALAVNQNNPEIMVLSTHNWEDYGGGKIYLSRDGGNQWTDITEDLPNGAGASAAAFDPQNSYLYILSYGGSIYRYKL